MISIVIPTRNEADYLEKTLKQYVALKDKLDLEIIVSDGRSTDGTLEIARRYADQVIIPDEGTKQNIAIGRNAGAFASKGDFIFETDADVILPDPEVFLRTMLRQFDDPRVVAAMAPLHIYPEEERLKDRFFHFIINSTIVVANHLGSFLSRGECQFVRATTFRKIGGYDESVVVGEDGNLFYRLAKEGKIRYVNSLHVLHSPRRFRKTGYVGTLSSYMREGFYLFCFGRSYAKEWAPIR